MAYPKVLVQPSAERRVRAGVPWVFSNQIQMDEVKGLAPGSVVRVVLPKGETLGLAHFNPHSLISLRLLTRDRAGAIDRAFFVNRLKRALRLRARFFDHPYYRLVHAEGDFLPGLVIDRFGGIVVVQANTAGMDACTTTIAEALDEVIGPDTLVLRNDSPMRELEGLSSDVRCLKGSIDGPITLNENGVRYLADVTGGQKTGWYYDQRANRALIGPLCRDQHVLDVYAYSGSFGLLAARYGAARVTCIDRSAPALALLDEAAKLNDLAGRIETRCEDAFTALGAMVDRKDKAGVVLLDPPSFVKSKRELAQGLRAYRKLVRLGAPLVSDGGFLAISSCAHNVDDDAFAGEVRRGLRDAGRAGRLVHRGGAGVDHPLHPALPETAYLKFHLYALD